MSFKDSQDWVWTWLCQLTSCEALGNYPPFLSLRPLLWRRGDGGGKGAVLPLGKQACDCRIPGWKLVQSHLIFGYVFVQIEDSKALIHLRGCSTSEWGLLPPDWAELGLLFIPIILSQSFPWDHFCLTNVPFLANLYLAFQGVVPIGSSHSC